MSYWVYLRENQKEITVPHFEEGGTMVVGGSDRAELNITYNYHACYSQYLDKEQGLRWLHGKRAGDTIERLSRAVAMLGVSRDEDYWKPTRGNAGYALNILLGWARLHPAAVWSVSG